MGIAIKISGGTPVYGVIERYFARNSEARQYLGEWKVTLESAKLTNSNRCFDFGHYSFLLSHPLADVLDPTIGDLPDNDMASTYRDNANKYRNPLAGSNTTRGSAGDESRKHHVPDGMTGANPDRPRGSTAKPAAKDGATINLKQLCQELKLDPSKARQKLRKAFGATGARYEWAPGEEVEKVRKVLAG